MINMSFSSRFSNFHGFLFDNGFATSLSCTSIINQCQLLPKVITILLNDENGNVLTMASDYDILLLLNCLSLLSDSDKSVICRIILVTVQNRLLQVSEMFPQLSPTICYRLIDSVCSMIAFSCEISEHESNCEFVIITMANLLAAKRPKKAEQQAERLLFDAITKSCGIHLSRAIVNDMNFTSILLSYCISASNQQQHLAICASCLNLLESALNNVIQHFPSSEKAAVCLIFGQTVSSACISISLSILSSWNGNCLSYLILTTCTEILSLICVCGFRSSHKSIISIITSSCSLLSGKSFESSCSKSQIMSSILPLTSSMKMLSVLFKFDADILSSLSSSSSTIIMALCDQYSFMYDEMPTNNRNSITEMTIFDNLMYPLVFELHVADCYHKNILLLANDLIRLCKLNYHSKDIKILTKIVSRLSGVDREQQRAVSSSIHVLADLIHSIFRDLPGLSSLASIDLFSCCSHSLVQLSLSSCQTDEDENFRFIVQTISMCYKKICEFVFSSSSHVISQNHMSMLEVICQRFRAMYEGTKRKLKSNLQTQSLFQEVIQLFLSVADSLYGICLQRNKSAHELGRMLGPVVVLLSVIMKSEAGSIALFEATLKSQVYDLWYYLVLFQFAVPPNSLFVQTRQAIDDGGDEDADEERTLSTVPTWIGRNRNWESLRVWNLEWHSACWSIAEFMPSLLYQKGGTSIGYLERELTHNSILKLSHSPNTVKSLQSFILDRSGSVSNKRINLPVSVQCYLASIICLESCRLFSAHKIESLLEYFSHDSILASNNIKSILFPALEGIVRRYTISCYNISKSSPPSYVLECIKSVAKNLLLKAACRFNFVRIMCLQFLRLLLVTFPQLIVSERLISTLLHTLSGLKRQLIHQFDQSEMNLLNGDVIVNLPRNRAYLSSSVQDYCRLCYEWCISGLYCYNEVMKTQLRAILIEMTDADVAKDLVNEVLISTCPVYHNSMGFIQQKSDLNERAAASMFVAADLTRRLDYLKQDGSNGNKVSLLTNHEINRRPVSIISDTLKTQHSQSLFPQSASSKDKNEDTLALYTNALDSIESSQYSAASDPSSKDCCLFSIIQDRHVANIEFIIHQAETMLQFPPQINLELNLIESYERDLPLLINCDDLGSGIAKWRVLLACCRSKSRKRVIWSECISCFMKTWRNHLGLFVGDDDDTRGSESSTNLLSSSSSSCDNIHSIAHDCELHVMWFDFMLEQLEVDPQLCCHLLMVNLSSFIQDLHRISRHQSMFGPTFRLLNLCLKALHFSYRHSQHSSFFRRNFREKIFLLAFHWFDKCPMWVGSGVSKSTMSRDMKEFSQFEAQISIEDPKRWELDLMDDVSSEADDRVAKNRRATLASLGRDRFQSWDFINSRNNDATPPVHRNRFSKQNGVQQPSSRFFEDESICKNLLPLYLNLSEGETADALFGYYRAAKILLLFMSHENDRIVAWHNDAICPQQLRRSSERIKHTHNFPPLKDLRVAHVHEYVRISWNIRPSIALRLCLRLLYIEDLRDAIRTEIRQKILESPQSVSHMWEALSFVLDPSLFSASDASASLLSEMPNWSLGPAWFAIQVMTRFYSANTNVPEVFYYCMSCIQAQPPETIMFYVPQLVQLMRYDRQDKIQLFLRSCSLHSTLVAHQLLWILKSESGNDDDSSHSHGFQSRLAGSDCLPVLCDKLENQIIKSFDWRAKRFFESEFGAFEAMTSISGDLKKILDKDKHNAYIKEKLEKLLPLPNYLYMPTENCYNVISVDVESGTPMQSAAKCPFLVVFKVRAFAGPDYALSMIRDQPPSSPRRRDMRLGSFDCVTEAPVVISGSKLLDIMSSVQARQEDNLNEPDSMYESKNDDAFFSQVNGALSPRIRGDSVTSQASSPSQHAVDANKHMSLFRRRSVERFQSLRKDFHRIQSEMNAEKQEKPKWRQLIGRMSSRSRDDDDDNDPNAVADSRKIMHERIEQLGLRSPDKEFSQALIFKVFDDCRQDAITIQVIRILRDVFSTIGLPLYVYPYSVIPNRTGVDKIVGGIIHVVPKCKSRDQIGKAGSKTLLQYYVSKFGSPDSHSYQVAKLNFARSLAGYAIVCYLLWIKDRHNGNILIDSEGHIIHIDFGFLLGISPGGNLGFENAAFKFTSEMVDIMGGLTSETFHLFVELCIQGYLCARRVMEPICCILETMLDSGLPCFHFSDTIDKLHARFAPNMSDIEAAQFMRGLIMQSFESTNTIIYDGIQKIQNNIYSDSWK